MLARLIGLGRKRRGRRRKRRRRRKKRGGGEDDNSLEGRGREEESLVRKKDKG